MSYDKKTNERAVKAYSHPAVGDYIPAPSKTRYGKPSLWARIKKFLRGGKR